MCSLQVGPIDVRLVATASTREQRERGLSNKLEPEPMLFWFGGTTTRQGFWMKDTPVPLSILFVDDKHKVVARFEMPTCKLDCPTYRPSVPYLFAVEAPSGVFSHTLIGETATLAEHAQARPSKSPTIPPGAAKG